MWGKRESAAGVKIPLTALPRIPNANRTISCVCSARKTVSRKYDLEYGQAEVEIHEDAIRPGQKVIIVDDLIATGGSAEAAAKLVEDLGGEVVGMFFVMELGGLKGRERLKGYPVKSLILYPGK